jgi:hypothetical protein
MHLIYLQNVNESINRLEGMQRVLDYYLMDIGQTMGPADYVVSPESEASNATLLDAARRWCLKNPGNYDMRKQNAEETQIGMMVEGTRKAIFNNLLGDIKFRAASQCLRNGMLDLILSAAKGKLEHAMHMGK